MASVKFEMQNVFKTAKLAGINQYNATQIKHKNKLKNGPEILIAKLSFSHIFSFSSTATPNKESLNSFNV